MRNNQRFYINTLQASLLLLAAATLSTGCARTFNSSPEEPVFASLPSGVSAENRSLKPRKKPIAPGDATPSFVLSDQKGVLVSAGELTSGKGAVLIIVPPHTTPAARPVWEWARKNQLLLSQRGIELVLVTPESIDKNADVAAAETLRLAVLSDPASWVARSMGVVTEGQATPSSCWMFYLGPDGLVHFAERGLPNAAGPMMAAETLPGKSMGSAFPW